MTADTFSNHFVSPRKVTVRTAEGQVFHVIQEERVEHPPPPIIGVAYLGAIFGIAIGGPFLGLLALGGAIYIGRRQNEGGGFLGELDRRILNLFALCTRVKVQYSILSTVVRAIKKLADLVVGSLFSQFEVVNRHSSPSYSEDQKVMVASAAVALTCSLMIGSILGLMSGGMVVFASTWDNLSKASAVDLGDEVLWALDRIYYGNQR